MKICILKNYPLYIILPLDNVIGDTLELIDTCVLLPKMKHA